MQSVNIILNVMSCTFATKQVILSFCCLWILFIICVPVVLVHSYVNHFNESTAYVVLRT